MSNDFVGNVPLGGHASPTSPTDMYATHIDTFGKGGYMTVETVTDRDGIPEARRKEGMLVNVVSENKIYKLVNNAWVVLESGGGSIDTSDFLSKSEGGIIESDLKVDSAFEVTQGSSLNNVCVEGILETLGVIKAREGVYTLDNRAIIV